MHTVGDPQNNSIIKIHGHLKFCVKLTTTCCSSCYLTWPSEVLYQTGHHLLLFLSLFLSLHMAVWSAVPNWPPLALYVTSRGYLKCCAKLTTACCSLCHFTWVSQVLYQTDHCLPCHITGNNKSPVAPGTSDQRFVWDFMQQFANDITIRSG